MQNAQFYQCKVTRIIERCICLQQPIVISASSQMRCRYEAFIFRTFCSSWGRSSEENIWNLKWQFLPRSFSDDLKVEFPHHQALEWDPLAYAASISLQIWSFHDKTANKLCLGAVGMMFDFSGDGWRVLVAWRLWAHNAKVSASRERTLDSPQICRLSRHGLVDPSTSFPDIATNNRI